MLTYFDHVVKPIKDSAGINMYVHRCMLRHVFKSLRHSAGPLAFGQQAQSRGCVKLVGVKGGLHLHIVKGGLSKSWFV